ncbi:MAG: hypothetical protein ACK4QP_02620 [Pseudorhizobium sp.]
MLIDTVSSKPFMWLACEAAGALSERLTRLPCSDQIWQESCQL